MTTAHGSIQVELEHTRSTKNTERFDATDPDAVITSIYVQKSAFQGTAVPARIRVSVCDVNDGE